MTQARRRLWLSYAQRRMQFGEVRQNPPSRFLADLPKEGVRRVGRLAGGGYRAPVRDGAPAPEMAMTGKPLDLTKMLSRAKGKGGEDGRMLPADEQHSPLRGGGVEEGTQAVAYAVGERVKHATYGSGLVVAVDAEGEKATVTVAFPKGGLHKFDAARARLQKSG